MTQGSQTPAICIGHSHSACVAEAARQTGAALEVLNFWEMPGTLTQEADRAVLAPQLLARLRAPLFSLVGGAVHHDVGLLMHRLAWDFIDPAEPDAPGVPDAVQIPYDAVAATLKLRTQPYLRIMAAVRAAFTGPMFHMQSPPIFADEAPEEQDPAWVAFHGPGRRIAPAAFRRKLWRLHSSVVAEFCAGNEITFVPCPAGAFNTEGYLREGLNGKPAHANAAYGALVLRQMEERKEGLLF